VDEYADALRNGATFPAVLAFFSGTKYWLADGFHRIEAALRIGQQTIAVEVRQGTRREAVLYACGANAQHGLRRSDQDKARAVLTLLHDDEWSQWSYREIARRCHVSHDFVRKVAERHNPHWTRVQ
jgi:ParB-like chromosome segregation protein Spo0J